MSNILNSDDLRRLLEVTEPTIQAKLDKLDRTMNDIHHRLFIDNGAPSIQTRLDRHEQTLANLTKMTWASITVALGVLAAKLVGK